MTADQFDPASYWYWNEGTERRAQRLLGAHPDPAGTTFAVWAPNASAVSVVGDHDGWNEAAHPMEPVGASGVWAGRRGRHARG